MLNKVCQATLRADLKTKLDWIPNQNNYKYFIEYKKDTNCTAIYLESVFSEK